MRICRVTQTFPTTAHNGIGLHGYHTSNALRYPTLVLTSATSETFLPVETHVTVKAIRYPHRRFPATQKQILGYIASALVYLLGQMIFTVSCLREIKKFQPDVIHLQSPHAFLTGFFAKLFFRCPVVMTFHGSDYVRFKKFPFAFKLINYVDHFCCVSSNMIEEFSKRFGAHRVTQTNSGVDLDFFKDQKKLREKTFLSVGNLRWQKDYPNLLNSLKQVFQKLPEFNAVIIGSGPDHDSLLALSKSLGISSKVHFLGQQSHAEIRDWMNRAQLFVLSSSTEGMPKVLHEALACGLPVVGTDVGSVRDVVGDGGICVPKENPEQLAHAIIQLSTDEAQYLRAKEKTSTQVMRYSWNELSNTLDKIFRQLVNKS